MMKFLKVEETFPSENWNLLGSTVLTGLVVVFIALILLIIAFWLIGVFFAPKTKKKPDSEADPVQIPAPAPETAHEPEIQSGIPGEIIAVISAAVSAYSEKDGKAYRIHSVRAAAHTARNPWNAAGLIENMRGF